MLRVPIFPMTILFLRLAVKTSAYVPWQGGMGEDQLGMLNVEFRIIDFGIIPAKGGARSETLALSSIFK